MDNQHNHHRRLDMNPLLVGLLGILAGTIVVAICNCIIVLCNDTPMQRPDRTNTISTNRSQNNNVRANSSLEHSTVQVVLQPKKCIEDLCAVCLGELKEGEGVRVLPECTHIFHVSCIDKWLENHPNCPLCRASAIPQSHVNVAPVPDSGGIPAEEMNWAPELGGNVV